MFHAGTPSEVKEHIMVNATNADSCLRVIICTISFGMGINCKGFNTVIHFGPSKDQISSYNIFNDMIYSGPSCNFEFFGVLLRFRCHPIAVVCDIAEMY